ncbi:MAG TPA: hypothetical protein VKA09_16250 [Nitrososphaeraceae archaeon]|nr:hypothetical protein [Nitrososphaeraceae archaeon]
MNHQTSIDLDNAIIDAFNNAKFDDIYIKNKKTGRKELVYFITIRQLIDRNPWLQAVLYRAHHAGVYYKSEREEEFVSYRITQLLKSEPLANLLREHGQGDKPFAILHEWIGPVVINGLGTKRMLRAWVKRPREVGVMVMRK